MAEMTVDGMEGMLANLQQLGVKAARVENRALKAGAVPLARRMRNNVRLSSKRHKHIQDDIQVSNVKTQDGVKFVEVGPGKETGWRAKFLEFGTSKMSARPFVEPSALESEGEVAEAIADVLRAELGL